MVGRHRSLSGHRTAGSGYGGEGAGPSIRERRGLRIALLSLATAILLLGASAAALFCYLTVTHGVVLVLRRKAEPVVAAGGLPAPGGPPCSVLYSPGVPVRLG
jgi:hypothetical protein